MIRISISPALEKLAKKMETDVDGAIAAGMTNLVETVEANAVKIEKSHVRTSNLINSISSHIENNGRKGVVEATAKYAVFVHDGTGIYGPYHTRIVPKTAKALKIPGIGYRKSVKGFKGRPFMDMALLQIKPQQVFDQGIGNFMKMKGW